MIKTKSFNEEAILPLMTEAPLNERLPNCNQE